jgi:hypothetical protein
VKSLLRPFQAAKRRDGSIVTFEAEDFDLPDLVSVSGSSDEGEDEDDDDDEEPDTMSPEGRELALEKMKAVKDCMDKVISCSS